MRNENNESGYWSGAAHDQYMKLYSSAMTTPDPIKRKDLYRQMQQILQDEVPAVLPAGRNNMLVTRPNVHNLKNHPQHWSIRWDEVWKS